MKSFNFLVFIFFCFTTRTAAQDRNYIGISLHSGLFLVDGDIDGKGPGVGFRIQFPTHSILAVRANAAYHSAKGLGVQPWTHSTFGGGLIESVYTPYLNEKEGWFPSYHFQQTSIEFEGQFSIMKTIAAITDDEFDAIDVYLLGGLGLFRKQTNLDLLDQNGLPYSNLASKALNGQSFETKSGRDQIRKTLRSIYDGNYETTINYSAKFNISFGAGFSFKLNELMSIGLEHKMIFYPNVDYIDGIRFRTAVDQTTSKDKATYSSMFLMIKI